MSLSLPRSLLLLGLAALALTACSDARKELGLGRSAPDEFAVVNRPPLSMPPDYTLRPPRPGAPPLHVVNPEQSARKALLGNAASPASESVGEQALLKEAGVSKALPDIRAIVNREEAQRVVASPHLVQRLMDWSDSDQKPAATVDAAAEAARIKKAQEEKKPIDQGATPVIERQKTGWLGL
ncbi:MAG: DUF3035 domain-containing protein [Alphaproteobacteria bacterium]|nr:DUF3035 domain-containing protein [Alphaproteobacteria bacterium]